MINNTTLVGRLTKNPEVKYTGSGIAVANFILAVERTYTNTQGERETDFINCVIWRDKAENLSKLAVQGTLLGITGAIETRNYENNQGQKVYVTEVKADGFQLLESKKVNDERRKQAQQNNGTNNNYNNGNYNDNGTGNRPTGTRNNTNGTKENPFESKDDATDIQDDDLPF